MIFLSIAVINPIPFGFDMYSILYLMLIIIIGYFRALIFAFIYNSIVTDFIPITILMGICGEVITPLKCHIANVFHVLVKGRQLVQSLTLSKTS